MKQRLIAAVLAVGLALNGYAHAANQRTDTMAGSKVVDFGYVQDIAASNATLTIKAAVASQYISLYGLLVSVDANDYVYLTCGGVQKTSRIYLAANSGISQIVFPFYIQCGSNEALAIVRGAAATKIGVNYWLRQEP